MRKSAVPVVLALACVIATLTIAPGPSSVSSEAQTHSCFTVWQDSVRCLVLNKPLSVIGGSWFKLHGKTVVRTKRYTLHNSACD